MGWFFIALIAPALWAASNHLDKFLIEKYFKSGGPGALIIFSSLIGLVTLPFIFLIQPSVANLSLNQTLLVVLSGIISTISILVYLWALNRDEASIVVPLFQTIPVFAFVLGYIFLKEELSWSQIFGSLLIISGGVALSLETENFKLKKNVFFLMLFSSFLIAASGLLFKMVAVETDFWVTTFWAYVGNIIMGFFFLLFFKKYRQEFYQVFRDNKSKMIGLNIFNEFLDVIASLSIKFATLIAPLALVWTVNGFQPFFVFLFGVIITLAFPWIAKENLKAGIVIQKLATISVMFWGVYLINN